MANAANCQSVFEKVRRITEWNEAACYFTEQRIEEKENGLFGSVETLVFEDINAPDSYLMVPSWTTRISINHCRFKGVGVGRNGLSHLRLSHTTIEDITFESSKRPTFLGLFDCVISSLPDTNLVFQHLAADAHVVHYRGREQNNYLDQSCLSPDLKEFHSRTTIAFDDDAQWPARELDVLEIKVEGFIDLKTLPNAKCLILVGDAEEENFGHERCVVYGTIKPGTRHLELSGFDEIQCVPSKHLQSLRLERDMPIRFPFFDHLERFSFGSLDTPIPQIWIDLFIRIILNSGNLTLQVKSKDLGKLCLDKFFEFEHLQGLLDARLSATHGVAEIAFIKREIQHKQKADEEEKQQHQ